MRLGYVHIRVTDLEEARNHYSNTLGMKVVHEEPGKLLAEVLGRVRPPLPGAGGGRRRAGQARLQGGERATTWPTYESRSQQFGATTGRCQQGREPHRRRRGADHPAVRAGHRAVQRHRVHRHRHRRDQPRPVAAERRGVGAHWIDHALVPAEDPGLVERFFMEVLDFRAAERAVTSMSHPEVLGSWMSCGRVAARLRRGQGPQRQAAPLRVPPGGLERDPAGRRHLQHGRRLDRHRPDPARHHPGHDDLLLRPVRQPQRGLRRPRLPRLPGLPDGELDRGPARQGHLLHRASSTTPSPASSHRNGEELLRAARRPRGHSSSCVGSPPCACRGRGRRSRQRPNCDHEGGHVGLPMEGSSAVLSERSWAASSPREPIPSFA